MQLVRSLKNVGGEEINLSSESCHASIPLPELILIFCFEVSYGRSVADSEQFNTDAVSYGH